MMLSGAKCRSPINKLLVYFYILFFSQNYLYVLVLRVYLRFVVDLDDSNNHLEALLFPESHVFFETKNET